MAVDRKHGASQIDGIRKRTPLEQAIAEQTDRKARYEARRRKEGFKRTTVLVREEFASAVQKLAKLANGDEKEQALFLRLVQQAGVDA